MPALGRKFLMAVESGLNLTHSEDCAAFLTRFGAATQHLDMALKAFTPGDVMEWAKGLGVETFTGSSGRIFPVDFKAAPLLRAWLKRLRAAGLVIHVRHRWRSEERRVGKECVSTGRSWLWPTHSKKNKT